MNQQVKSPVWVDEQGKEVPINYITPIMRLKERHSARILKQAKSINKQLSEFKDTVRNLTDEVWDLYMEQFKASGKTPGKGSFTFTNFDRSIKIEVSISDRIEFDDLTLAACKEKLDMFLAENLDAKTEFVKELVTDAFSTTKGQIDSKKVMSLMRYKGKIKGQLFQEAMDLLSDSIRRPDSKTYFRVWERQEDGSYKAIDLNFSSI